MFGLFNTHQFKTNTYEISDDFSNIVVNAKDADIEFLTSNSEKSSVVCYEKEKLFHSVSVQDGTLLVELVDSRNWYDYIDFNFTPPKISVYLSKNGYERISVNSKTGDINLNNISADELRCTLSTGDLKLSSVTCKGDIAVDITTGDIKMTDVNCQNLDIMGSTGNAKLKNVISAEKLNANVSTGDVIFDGADAGELYIKTSTGNVSGSLLTPKVFIATTDTGSIDLPETITGGKCKIETNTGNIKITIK